MPCKCTRKNKSHMEKFIQSVFPNAKIISVSTPSGGSSAEMQIVSLRLDDGSPHKIVLRRQRHIEQERDLLQWLQSAEVVAPRPLAFEPASRTLMLTFTEGKSRYDADPTGEMGPEIGKQLAKIHAVPIPPNGHIALPSQTAELWPNKNCQHENEIRTHLEPRWPFPQTDPLVLIHGDFWPGNMLWKAQSLVGVIDWEDAKLGNRYQDLAISRFDTCFIFGRQTMLNLTQTYRQYNPIDAPRLAEWDLYAALRASHGIPQWAAGFPELGRPDLTEEAIWETHRWFIDQAIARLDASNV